MKFTLGQARELSQGNLHLEPATLPQPAPPPAPAVQAPASAVVTNPGQVVHVHVHNQRPPKSKVLALVLWFFLGGIGAHHFYLGRTTFGILYIVSCLLVVVTLGLWLIVHGLALLVDLIWILVTPENQLEKRPS